MAPIVYQHITNFNAFFLPMQLWDWEGSVSIPLLQQSVRPVSELGYPGSLGSTLHGPIATVPLPQHPHHKGNPSLEARRGYGIPYPDPKCEGVEYWDRRVHCRAHFSGCLELASETKSFGSLNATDFNKVDFKCTYEPRLRQICALKWQPDLTVM